MPAGPEESCVLARAKRLETSCEMLPIMPADEKQKRCVLKTSEDHTCKREALEGQDLPKTTMRMRTERMRAKLFVYGYGIDRLLLLLLVVVMMGMRRIMALPVLKQRWWCLLFGRRRRWVMTRPRV